ncbi:MAG: phosphatase PAP2 family protein [Patescibacteria group bacterium]
MLDSLIIFCAKYLVVAPLGGALALARAQGLAAAKKIALEVALALPVAYLLARLAGLLYQHEQPFAAWDFLPLIPHEVDNSFPSDHMLVAAVFATAAYLRHRYLGLSLWAFAGLLGIARVAAGLHYPVDLVAASLIAIAAVYAARALAAYAKLR